MKRKSSSVSWFNGDFNTENYGSSSSSIKKSSDNFSMEYNISLDSELSEPSADSLTMKDLAVSSKKIDDVRTWIKNSIKNLGYRKILILSGPSGSAKTTTVKMIAKELNISIREWETPTDKVNEISDLNWRDESLVHRVPQSTLFKNFLREAGKYNSIIHGDSSSIDNLVIIEEFPNIRPLDFQSAVKAFGGLYFPLIFITGDGDSDIRCRSLLTPEFVTVLGLENIKRISFNPITTTNTIKAMKLALGPSVNSVPQERLQEIAESSKGDLRAAINSLRFSYSKSKFWKQKVLKEKQKKNKSVKKDTLKLKDFSLDIFHTLGKVLYAKRLDTSESFASTSYTPTIYRRNLPKTDPEDILNTSTLSHDALTAFLHQNYIDFFNCVSNLEKACEYLSLSDTFSNSWKSGSKFDLKEYGAELSVRGLYFHSPGGQSFGKLKTFNKPEVYGLNKISRTKERELKSVFLCRSLTNKELFSSFVPTLVHCTPCSESVKEVGRLYSKVEIPFKGYNLINGGSSLQNLQEEIFEKDDDELKIEEFDD